MVLARAVAVILLVAVRLAVTVVRGALVAVLGVIMVLGAAGVVVRGGGVVVRPGRLGNLLGLGPRLGRPPLTKLTRAAARARG